MVLVLAGLGTSLDYASIKLLDELSTADVVLVEAYTSIAVGYTYERLRRMCLGELRYVSRRDLEENYEWIIEMARNRKVVILVAGDPLTATTHVSLLVEAKKKGVDIDIVLGVSGVYASITQSYLQAYRFGRIVTLTYPEKEYIPYTTVEVVRENLERNLHTLVLLDIRFDEGRAMRINEAVELLLRIEEEYCKINNCEQVLDKVIGVGVARAATPDMLVKADLLPKLKNYNFPPPPHSLVVVAKPHPMELEALVELAGLPIESIKESVYADVLRYTSYSKPAT